MSQLPSNPAVQSPQLPQQRPPPQQSAGGVRPPMQQQQPQQRPPQPGQGFPQGRPAVGPGRPSPSPVPPNAIPQGQPGVRPSQQPQGTQFQRPFAPQGARPPGGAPGMQQQQPPRNGALTPGIAAQHGRMSPRPQMPPPNAMQSRPPMPPQQQFQQSGAPQPGQFQQQQQQQSAPTAQMGQMSLGNQGGPPPPEPAPARTKRSARAYHVQEEAPQPAPGQEQWQTPGVPHQQAEWQREAAERVAGYDNAMMGGGQNDNSALDQLPGQRNLLSPAQLASNQARMAHAQGQSMRGPLQAQGGAAGSFSQAMPNVPLGPQTPGPGPAPQLAPGQAPPLPGQGGIQQPPHSAGQRFAGPRSKIDPDQIPAPVEAQDADQDYFDKEWFLTCGRGGLPLSTTDFGAVDQGNCSPKHMRLTTYSMPHSDELAATSQLPIAVVIQPFAQQRPDEGTIPVVPCGPDGPPRCKRCRAYINAWCVFVEGGQKWMCNLCGGATEVRAEYFCNLDMSGRRVDFEQRPELSRGTVDFEVPKEYWAIQSQPPASVLLPVAPALTAADTASLTPHTEETSGHAFAGSNLGLSGQGAVAAKAATKAASDALSNVQLAMGPGGRTTVRAPRPMTYLFALDVSYSAVRCGSLQSCVAAIRESLYGPRADKDGPSANGASGDPAPVDPEAPGFGLPHGSRIAILTFDRSLHFWNLLPTLEQAQMLVVADIEEPFIPISEGLLADPWESRTLVENLLDSLPSMFADNMAAEAALGAAVRGVQAALSTIGGQANIFLATIPTMGPGSLKHREDTKLYGTDKEKNLFAPQDTFYRNTAEECVEAGIGINVFFFPSQYIDVATIGSLAGGTGGELYFHPRFDPVRDGVKLTAQIQRCVLREAGYNVTMRLRCSNGLHVTEHHGNLLQRNATDVEMGTIDADKAIACLIKHEGRLDEKQEAHFQCAILYTTAQGQRRVRSHNIAVPVTNLLGNVFRYADMDSTVAYYMKEAIASAHVKPLKEVRHYITEKCVKVLLAYRRNCASSTSPGQLILPESFKLFPLYALGINKTKAIKGGNVTSDVRAFYMRSLRSLGVGATMAFLYPRMIALHTMSEDDGFPVKVVAEDGSESVGMRIKTPPLMRPSYLRMEAHGAYLVENGDLCIIWIGAQANPRLLEDLYGASSLDELDVRMTTLPKLPTRLSQQARNLVNGFAKQRCKPSLPVLIARQSRDGTEVELANNLVEDQNNDAMSYVDYLCHVHRVITNEMSGTPSGGNKDEGSGITSMFKGW